MKAFKSFNSSASVFPVYFSGVFFRKIHRLSVNSFYIFYFWFLLKFFQLLKSVHPGLRLFSSSKQNNRLRLTLAFSTASATPVASAIRSIICSWSCFCSTLLFLSRCGMLNLFSSSLPSSCKLNNDGDKRLIWNFQYTDFFGRLQ